jgi:hypothetical protein
LPVISRRLVQRSAEQHANIQKALHTICLGSALLFAPGCRQKTTYPVSGTVSFDGEAVSNGQILFLAIDKSSAPAAGRIEEGAYRIEASAGPKRVQIRAARVVRQAPEAIGPEYQDYIPGRFNTESTLSAEVKPDNENRFDFQLEP